MMKIKTSVLKAAANAASRFATDRKDAVPVLTYVSVGAQMQATDLESYYCEALPGGTDPPVLIPSKLLKRFTETAEEDTVEITEVAGNPPQAVVAAGTTTLRYAALAHAEYPSFPQVGDATVVECLHGDLQRTLARLLLFSSTDVSRPHLYSAAFYPEAQKVGDWEYSFQFAATDEYRLVLLPFAGGAKGTNVCSMNADEPYVMARGGLDRFVKLPVTSNGAALSLGEKYWAVRWGPRAVIGARPEVAFPLLQQAIPRRSAVALSLELDAADLHRRLLKLEKLSGQTYVAFDLGDTEGGVLRIGATDGDVCAGDTVPCRAHLGTQDVPARIGLNAAYVRDILQGGAKTAVLHIQADKAGEAVYDPTVWEIGNELHVLMLMRLRD